MAQIIKPREVFFDRIVKHCNDQTSGIDKLQESLFDVSESMAEFKEDGILDDTTAVETKQRVLNLGMKNVLLRKRIGAMVDSLNMLQNQVVAGQYQVNLDVMEGSELPNFQNHICAAYGSRALAFSSSSSSSSSSSHTTSIHPLSDSDAKFFAKDEIVAELNSNMNFDDEEDEAMDSDEDLRMVDTQQSTANLKARLTCQITQSRMEHPVKCKPCGHTFDKKGILEMIKKNPSRAVQCPMGGCNKIIRQSDLEDDKKMFRMLKKLAKIEEREKEEALTQQLSDVEDMMVV